MKTIILIIFTLVSCELKKENTKPSNVYLYKPYYIVKDSILTFETNHKQLESILLKISDDFLKLKNSEKGELQLILSYFSGDINRDVLNLKRSSRLLKRINKIILSQLNSHLSYKIKICKGSTAGMISKPVRTPIELRGNRGVGFTFGRRFGKPTLFDFNDSYKTFLYFRVLKEYLYIKTNKNIYTNKELKNKYIDLYY